MYLLQMEKEKNPGGLNTSGKFPQEETRPRSGAREKEEDQLRKKLQRTGREKRKAFRAKRSKERFLNER